MKNKTLKKYLVFAKAAINNTLTYRAEVLIWFLSGAISSIIMALLWYAIYQFSPESAIAGFSYPQMLMYLICVACINELMYSETYSTVVDDIQEGMIGIQLMKPVNYRTRLIFGALGSFCSRFLLTTLVSLIAGTLIAVYAFGAPPPVWWHALLLLPSIYLSLMLFDAIDFLLSLLSFKTQSAFGISQIKDAVLAFLTGAVIPLALFPSWAQSILAFTPFPYMTSMPVLMFMGQYSGIEILQNFAISMAWVIALNALCYIMYKVTVKHVVVFGG